MDSDIITQTSWRSQSVDVSVRSSVVGNGDLFDVMSVRSTHVGDIDFFGWHFFVVERVERVGFWFLFCNLS